MTILFIINKYILFILFWSELNFWPIEWSLISGAYFECHSYDTLPETSCHLECFKWLGLGKKLAKNFWQRRYGVFLYNFFVWKKLALSPYLWSTADGQKPTFGKTGQTINNQNIFKDFFGTKISPTKMSSLEGRQLFSHRSVQTAPTKIILERRIWARK